MRLRTVVPIVCPASGLIAEAELLYGEGGEADVFECGGCGGEHTDAKQVEVE